MVIASPKRFASSYIERGPVELTFPRYSSRWGAPVGRRKLPRCWHTENERLSWRRVQVGVEFLRYLPASSLSGSGCSREGWQDWRDDKSSRPRLQEHPLSGPDRGVRNGVRRANAPHWRGAPFGSC